MVKISAQILGCLPKPDQSADPAQIAFKAIRSKATLVEVEGTLQKTVSLEDNSADPLSWKFATSNLAITQRRLGEVTEDLAKLDEAGASFATCETLDYEQEAPFPWACLQWNLADLALARYRLNPDPALLTEARDHIAKARAFFVEGSDYQTQRCDDLLADVNAAEAA